MNNYPYYPNPYNYGMQRQQQYQMPVNNQANNNRIYVQGEEAAKSYQVAPNVTVDLWDSEAPVIYLKSADMSGVPTMKILDYTVRDTSIPNTPDITPKSDFVTMEYISTLEDKINTLESKIERMNKKKSNLNKKGSD